MALSNREGLTTSILFLPFSFFAHLLFFPTGNRIRYPLLSFPLLFFLRPHPTKLQFFSSPPPLVFTLLPLHPSKTRREGRRRKRVAGSAIISFLLLLPLPSLPRCFYSPGRGVRPWPSTPPFSPLLFFPVGRGKRWRNSLAKKGGEGPLRRKERGYRGGRGAVDRFLPCRCDPSTRGEKGKNIGRESQNLVLVSAFRGYPLFFTVSSHESEEEKLAWRRKSEGKLGWEDTDGRIQPLGKIQKDTGTDFQPYAIRKRVCARSLQTSLVNFVSGKTNKSPPSYPTKEGVSFSLRLLFSPASLSLSLPVPSFSSPPCTHETPFSSSPIPILPHRKASRQPHKKGEWHSSAQWYISRPDRH